MQNTKATETEREITRMVKAKGLDPAVWCWVGVDDDNDVWAYQNEPELRCDSFYDMPVEYRHVILIGTIQTTEPQLFKFNPFYDEEQN